MTTTTKEAAIPRQVLGGLMNHHGKKPAQLKGTSPDDLSSLLKKLKLQLEAKIELLHGECIHEKGKVKEIFAAAMVKIPRNVKTMRVGEFNALYKCDLLSVIENLPEPTAAGKKRDRLETPAASTSTNGVGGGRVPLMTPSRTVRKGEVVYSKNGSPLEAADQGALIATVTKSKKRRTGSTGDGGGASLDLNLGDGQFISLQDPMNFHSLRPEEKNMAFQQLQMLRSQVDNALKNLQPQE